MDPFSITTGCLSLVGSITKLSLAINGFVRSVRDARSDLDSVSRELLSLKTVLELLAEDTKDPTKAFPASLERQITGIVKNCDGVVKDIEVSLEKFEKGGNVSKGIKWTLSGRDDITKLRSSLEAHKAALELALDMVTLTIAREIKDETHEIKNDTAAIKEDTAQILAEIARLQAKLPDDVDAIGSSGIMLQRYLDGLTSYAETVYDGETRNEPSPRSSLDISGPGLVEDGGSDIDDGVHQSVTKHNNVRKQTIAEEQGSVTKQKESKAEQKEIMSEQEEIVKDPKSLRSKHRTARKPKRDGQQKKTRKTTSFARPIVDELRSASVPEVPRSQDSSPVETRVVEESGICSGNATSYADSNHHSHAPRISSNTNDSFARPSVPHSTASKKTLHGRVTLLGRSFTVDFYDGDRQSKIRGGTRLEENRDYSRTRYSAFTCAPSRLGRDGFRELQDHNDMFGVTDILITLELRSLNQQAFKELLTKKLSAIKKAVDRLQSAHNLGRQNQVRRYPRTTVRTEDEGLQEERVVRTTRASTRVLKKGVVLALILLEPNLHLLSIILEKLQLAYGCSTHTAWQPAKLDLESWTMTKSSQDSAVMPFPLIVNKRPVKCLIFEGISPVGWRLTPIPVIVCTVPPSGSEYKLEFSRSEILESLLSWTNGLSDSLQPQVCFHLPYYSSTVAEDTLVKLWESFTSRQAQGSDRLSHHSETIVPTIRSRPLPPTSRLGQFFNPGGRTTWVPVMSKAAFEKTLDEEEDIEEQEEGMQVNWETPANETDEDPATIFGNIQGRHQVEISSEDRHQTDMSYPERRRGLLWHLFEGKKGGV